MHGTATGQVPSRCVSFPSFGCGFDPNRLSLQVGSLRINSTLVSRSDWAVGSPLRMKSRIGSPDLVSGERSDDGEGAISFDAKFDRNVLQSSPLAVSKAT